MLLKMSVTLATKPKLRAVPQVFALVDFQEEQRFLPLYKLFPTIFQALLALVMRPFFYIFGRIEVKGIENLKNIPHGVIVAPNHVSELDPLIVGSVIPFSSHLRPLFYTSRAKGQYPHSGWRQHFYGGLLFKLLGGYPVITGIHNYEQSLAAHIKLVDEGRAVVIFPEGTRTRDGNLREGKGGVAYLAYRTNAPIVPVAIEGVYQATIWEFLTFRRKIKISFGKPFFVMHILPSREIEVRDFHTAAQEVMKKIAELKG